MVPGTCSESHRVLEVSHFRLCESAAAADWAIAVHDAAWCAVPTEPPFGIRLPCESCAHSPMSRQGATSGPNGVQKLYWP